MKTTTQNTSEPITETTTPQNTLVVYAGGGYDGCVWELNCFAWDEKGVFHNIHTSGRDGVRSEGQALILLHNGEHMALRSSQVYIFDLTRESEIERLNDEVHPDYVYKILTYCKQEYIYFTESLAMRCTDCKRLHDIGDITIDENNYHGDGGIGIIYEGFLCNDCRSNRTCMDCGNVFDLKEIEQYSGLCVHCFHDRIYKRCDYVIVFDRLGNKLYTVESKEFDFSELENTDRITQDHYIVTDESTQLRYLVTDCDADICAIEDVKTVIGHNSMFYVETLTECINA